MYLTWGLDEDAQIDPYDPIGEIFIAGDIGKIEAHDILVDSFFEALVECVQNLSDELSITADVIDEPLQITMTKKNNEGTISYGDQFAKINKFDDFEAELKEAVQSLVTRLDNEQIKLCALGLKLPILRKYISKTLLSDNRRM